MRDTLIRTNNFRDYQMAKKPQTKKTEETTEIVEEVVDNSTSEEENTEEEVVVELLKEGVEANKYKNEEFIAWAKKLESWKEKDTKNDDAFDEALIYMDEFVKKFKANKKAAAAKRVKRIKEDLMKAFEEAGMDYDSDIEAEMRRINGRRQAAISRAITMKAKKELEENMGADAWKALSKEDQDKKADELKAEWKKKEEAKE